MSLVGTLRHRMLSFTNLANISTGAIGQTRTRLAIFVGEADLKAAGSLHLTLLLASLTIDVGVLRANLRRLVMYRISSQNNMYI